MRSVTILMSTYNGAQYIREQLASISSQLDVAPRVMVRDDGSQDDTVSLVKAFAERTCYEIVLDSGEHLGFNGSFASLVSAATRTRPTDYYAFSDQDDIWLPTKLARAIDLLEPNATGAAMALGHGVATDASLRPIPAATGTAKHFRHNLKNALVQGSAQGATIVMNRDGLHLLSGSLPYRPTAVNYDRWLYALFSAFGTVLVDEEPGLLYRQHSSNSIGQRRGIPLLRNRVSRAASVDGGSPMSTILRIALALKSMEESGPWVPHDTGYTELIRLMRSPWPRLGFIFTRGILRSTVFDEIALRLHLAFSRSTGLE